MINVEEVKKQILDYLEKGGPSLPIRVSRAIELSPVFSSAILSELVRERRVKMSAMKVGSSSLYFVPGHEDKLESFADEITGVEKNAFLKLKSRSFLKDDAEEPAIRVALRSLKDFAIPFKYEGILYWKYFKVNNEEAGKLVRQLGAGSGGELSRIANPPSTPAHSSESNRQISNSIEKDSGRPEEQKIGDIKEKPLLEIKEKKKKEKKIPEEFLNEVRDYLLVKDIEFLREMEFDKKSVVGKIRINSDFGKVVFLMVAKDKKKPTIADLTMAYQRAMEEKLPCYFLARGGASKSCDDFLKENGGLVWVGVM